jgi:hypothetical protein
MGREEFKDGARPPRQEVAKPTPGPGFPCQQWLSVYWPEDLPEDAVLSWESVWVDLGGEG